MFDAPGVFDAVVYGTDPGLLAECARWYDVVALPGTVPERPIEPGDVVVRRALGEGRLGDVVAAEALAPGVRLPYDRLVLRPRSGAEAEAVTCQPAQEPDPTGKGPHPLIRKPRKRPVVGYAQQCLGRWMTTHATAAHDCGDPAYVEAAFRQLRAAGQFPLVVDCDFGSKTDTATRAFQACSRIARDGAIGPITWPLLKRHDPGGTVPVVVPGRVTEIDVDGTFELFSDYFMPIPNDLSRNLFRAADRTAMATATEFPDMTATLAELATGKVLAAAPNGDFLLSLRGTLVLPAAVPETGSPLAVFVHGMHAVFRPNTASPDHEVASYRGYAYLQRDLAKRGIASLSVNANVVNRWGEGPKGDAQQRAQVVLLHLALLAALASGTTPAGSPLRIRVPGRGLVPLGTVLAETGPAEGPVAKLRSLTGAVREARLDFGRIGVFGHSRGAWAAMHVAECAAAAAAGSGLPPTTGDASDAATENAVARFNTGLVRATGRPLPRDVRALVAFEAEEDNGSPLAGLPEVFLLVVAATHDEDVGPTAVNVYEAPTCAKAAVVVHGGSHARFNTVWRDAPNFKRKFARTTKCQQPIRVLSEQSHEQVATAFVNDFLEARLRGVPRKLLLLTGERRAPLPVDVSRTWLFPHPVGTPGAVVSLDGGVTLANPAGTAPVPLAKDPNAPSRFRSDVPYRQEIPTFKVVRAQATTAELFAAVDPAHALATRTHFGFRLAKEIDITSAAARTSEPLRNFDLELRAANGAVVGRPVPGTAVPSIVQRPYPAKVWKEEGGKGECIEQTATFLQTVEVPLAQFLRGTSLTAADLARVTRIVVRMKPAPGKRGDDVFRITDLTLTTRTGI